MKKLYTKLENCYGISYLEHEFDFSKGKNIIIYAPNGTMKTSFAKTFMQLSKKKNPEEILHQKASTWDVKVDGNNIEAEEIFVIESFNERFKSDKLSTLLVDLDSMEEYNILNKEILDKKKWVSSLSG